jgi:hypothetical protein
MIQTNALSQGQSKNGEQGQKLTTNICLGQARDNHSFLPRVSEQKKLFKN